MDRDAVKAKIAVRKLLQDLASRKGLGDEWDQLTNDIKLEIIDAWDTIVLSVIKGN